jgi:hypothetical protein
MKGERASEGCRAGEDSTRASSKHSDDLTVRRHVGVTGVTRAARPPIDAKVKPATCVSGGGSRGDGAIHLILVFPWNWN